MVNIKRCESCQQLFKGRTNARTCSDRCRKRLQRVKQLMDMELGEGNEGGFVGDSRASVAPAQPAPIPAAPLNPSTLNVSEPPTITRPSIPALDNSLGRVDTQATFSPPSTVRSAAAPPPAVQLSSSEMPKQEDIYGLTRKPLVRRSVTVVIALAVMTLGGLLLTRSSNNPTSANLSGQSLKQLNSALSGSVAPTSLANGLNINLDTTIAPGKIFSVGGPVNIRNSADSAQAITVQNAAGDDLLVADTASGKVGIGGAPIGAAALQVTGDITASGSITSGLVQSANKLTANGGATSLSNQGLFINSTLICTADGCSSGTPFDGDASALNGRSGAYYTNASNLDAGTVDDTRLSSNVAFLAADQTFTGHNSFKSAINSATAFGIQNAAGSAVLNVNTVNSTVGVGTTNSVAELEIAGGPTGSTPTVPGSFGPSANTVKISAGNIYLPNGGSIYLGNTTGTSFQPILTRDSINSTEIRAGSGITVFTLDTSSRVGIGKNLTLPSLIDNGAVGLIALQDATPVTGSTEVVIEGGAGQSTTDLFQVRTYSALQGGGSKIVKVGSTGQATFQNSADSTTAFQIQNAAGTTTLFDADTTNGRIGIGTTTPSTLLSVVFNSNTPQQGIKIQNQSSGSSATAELQAANDLGALGEFGIQSSTNTTGYNSGLTGAGTVFIRSSSSANGLAFINGNTSTPTVFSNGSAERLRIDGATGNVGIGTGPTIGAKLQVNGSGLFKTDSTTAFQIQNSTGTPLFTADTTNMQISLGTPSATPVILVLGVKNTAGDPASCTSGGIYYNSNSNQFRGCVNGSWQSLSSGSSSPQYVTSLPGSPVDGQEVYYEADPTNGVIWHLRYSSAESTYHWEYLGGSSLQAVNASLSLPLAGDYSYNVSTELCASGSTAPSATYTLSTTSGSLNGSTAVTQALSQSTGTGFSTCGGGNMAGRDTGVSASGSLSLSASGNSPSGGYTITATPIRIN